MGVVLGSIIICIVVGIGILALLSPGKIAPFVDDKGDLIENSIAEKDFVQINGTQMGMIIKGKNIDNPVLLFVHGGPGMPEYFVSEDYETGLEEYFTVVWWDQRGAGLSYNSSIDKQEMTVEQFVEDTIAVSEYLRQRFGKEKIYLMSHSWGSFIGIQAVQKAPQLYAAYIGMGQMTNQAQSEKLAYEYMQNYYAAQGNAKVVKQLAEMNYLSKDYMKVRDKLMHQAGIGTMHEMKSVIKDIFFSSLGCKGYTLTEKINLWRGKIFASGTNLNDERDTKDLREKVTKLEVPTYFFSGKYDYTVNFSLTEAYLEQLEAPVKGFYLFENSAHSPIFEEPDKAIKILQEDVLNKTNTLANIK